MRRFVLGLVAITAAIGLTATPAAADNPYQPAESDFADCPAKPAGAQSWTCYAMTALDGLVILRNMKVRVGHPYRLTVAQGKLASGQSVAVLGSLKGEPLPFVTGVIGTPLEYPDPTGWKIELAATGLVEPGVLIPGKLGLRARVIGTGLGDNCWIGSNAAPVVVKPLTQWAVPWFFGSTPMLKAKVYDDVFAIPGATGCASPLVNILIGPANATSNHLDITWAIRHKTL